jgi:uncharacterized protein with HEPN domain
MTEREIGDYIEDIVTSIKEIEEFTKGMTFESFEKDTKTVNAVLRSLEVIGEAVRKIPQDVRDKFSEIPWKKITGMRDKLIHEYFGVDTEIVWQTVKKDIPYLKEQISNLRENF